METNRSEGDFGIVGPQLSMEWLFGYVELPSLTTYLAGIYLVVSHGFVEDMGALVATEFNCLVSSVWWGEDQRVDPGLAEDRRDSHYPFRLEERGGQSLGAKPTAV